MQMRALLLCEEPESIYLLSDVLRDLEIKVELCHEREQALERLLEQTYQAVIVDCDVDNASDMLRYVRVTGGNKNAVTLALVDDLAGMQGTLDNTANFVLCKPLAAEAVARSIRAMKGFIFRMGRRAIRVLVQTLAFVAVDSNPEHAIILDLSEGGMAIQALAPLDASKVLSLRFDLPGTKRRLLLQGEIAWADSSGRAGIRFLDVSEESRRALKDWIFVNAVAPSRIAMPANMRDRHLDHNAPSDFGASIEIAASSSATHPAMLSLAAETSAQRILASCVDAVIVVAATVLFALLVFEFSSTFPQSKLALPVGLFVPGLFWIAYHYLFMVDPRGTPGVQVAHLGTQDGDAEPITRYRRITSSVRSLMRALRQRLGEVQEQVQDENTPTVGKRVAMGPITISPMR